MTIMEQSITFAGEEMSLTNQRVLYWPRAKALVLSDLHLGKAAHFRKNGIAMPRQIAEQDIYRLEQLIMHYAAEQVIITGDLIHAGANKELELFAALTSRLPQVKFILIKGNHDRLTDDKLKALGVYAIYTTWTIDRIGFSHQYDRNTSIPTISGHIHPGITLQFPTNKRSRYPCYVVTESQIILPAFSLFTGLDTLSLPEKAVCYAFYEEGIFKVD